jgi:hypothetical protein
MFEMPLVIMEAIVDALYKLRPYNHLMSAAGSRLLWVFRAHAGRGRENHLTCAYKRGWKGCCVL